MFLVCLRLIPPSHIIPSKADSVASPNCSLIEISSVQWKGPDQRTTANSSSSEKDERQYISLCVPNPYWPEYGSQAVSLSFHVNSASSYALSVFRSPDDDSES